MNLSSFKKSSKVIGLVFLVGIVLIATIFLGRGAQNLFSRASACDVQKASTVQVTANSAVINWESNEVSSGSVYYGTNAGGLNFPAPEAGSGKTHNVPLSLLSPNTVYYYLISYGVSGGLPGTTKKILCDASGNSCDFDKYDRKECALTPWSFTTSAVTPQQQVVAPILSPTAAAASPAATKAVVASPSVYPTSNLSAFCTQVKANIGASSKDSSKWSSVKQYDIDGNGFINGMDVLKCPKTGK